MKEDQTHPSIIRMVILSLSGAMFIGILSTVYLITIKADAALVAVVAGFTGTALGQIGSVLNNTRSAPPTESQTVETTTTRTAAPPAPLTP